jgi:head-tail adaptor
LGIFNFFLGSNPRPDHFLFCESIFKKDKMRKSISIILLPFILVSVVGCAPLIIGAAAGGLGAYAISRDTVQGDSDKDYETLWESALNVAKIRGIIQQENAGTGYIELSAESSKIWIRLIRLTRATTRIKISARKYHFPNMKLAQDLFVKIITGVK